MSAAAAALPVCGFAKQAAISYEAIGKTASITGADAAEVKSALKESADIGENIGKIVSETGTGTDEIKDIPGGLKPVRTVSAAAGFD